jgi:hypothetical protein
MFVALAGSNVLTSTDAAIWTAHALPHTDNYVNIIYADGNYTFTGINFTNFGLTVRVTFQSTDTVNWVPLNPKPPFLITTVAQGNGITVGTGAYTQDATGDSSQPAISTNGLVWTPVSTGYGGSYNQVIFANGRFYAVAAQQVESSLDGTNWSLAATPIINDGDLTYGDLGFVAVGVYPITFLSGFNTSPDGITWRTEGALPSTLSNVLFVNGSYIAVGDGGTILQTIPRNAQAAPLLSGARGNGNFVLTAIAQPGYSYRIQKCTDLGLANWSDAFTFSSTQPVNQFLDPIGAAGSSAFYRIKTP